MQPGHPDLIEMTGTVQGYSGDHQSLAFTLDSGDTAGFHIADPALQNLQPGAHVTLTVIDVANRGQYVIAADPD